LQSLPREKAAIFLRGVKATGDLADLARFELGLVEARSFYINELGWFEEAFHSVDWLSLDFALEKKSKMYGIWLAKQASGFCGTRLMTSRYSNTSDHCCPNCLHPEENARHLNQCFNQERTRQFHESVKEMASWLEGPATHPDIAFWIPRYLLSRNKVKFADLPYYAPPYLRLRFTPSIRRLAEDQDKIGWTHFLEGKVSKQFLVIQQRYLAGTSTKLNGKDWMNKFIANLLNISHTQWLFRNVTLHDKIHGFLVSARRQDFIKTIEKLHDLPPSDIPKESQFLLDCDIEELRSADPAYQEHWIAALQAARTAGLRLRRLQLRQERQQNSPRDRLRRRQRSSQGPNPSSPHTQRRRGPLARPLAQQQPVLLSVFGDLVAPVTRIRPSVASMETELASNKRRKRRRRLETE